MRAGVSPPARSEQGICRNRTAKARGPVTRIDRECCRVGRPGCLRCRQPDPNDPLGRPLGRLGLHPVGAPYTVAAGGVQTAHTSGGGASPRDQCPGDAGRSLPGPRRASRHQVLRRRLPPRAHQGCRAPLLPGGTGRPRGGRGGEAAGDRANAGSGLRRPCARRARRTRVGSDRGDGSAPARRTALPAHAHAPTLASPPAAPTSGPRRRPQARAPVASRGPPRPEERSHDAHAWRTSSAARIQKSVHPAARAVAHRADSQVG